MVESNADHVDGGVGEARSAAAAADWEAAFGSFRRADADAPLSPGDLETYGTAAHLLGHTDVAVETLTRSHRAYLEAGATAPALRCGIWLVFILLGRGDVAQAGGWADRIARLVDGLGPDSAERGYMAVMQAFNQLAIEHRHAEACASAELAAELGQQAHDDDLVAMSLTIGGRALIYNGEPEVGLRRLDEAMAAVVTGVLSPLVAGTVYCSLIDVCEEIGELRRATEWTGALDRWCGRQQGMVTFTGQCLTHRARVLRRRGDLQGAFDQADRACARFTGAADQSAIGGALYELAEVHRIRGEANAAENAYRRAGEWGHDPQPGMALLRLAQGRTAAAEAAMRRVLTETSDPVARLKLLPAFVETMLVVDLDAARKAAEELTALAEHYGTTSLQAEAAMARGAVALGDEDGATALSALRSAEECWSALEAPYERARVKALIGQACDLLGDQDAAEIERESARRAFAELGATVDLQGLDGDDRRSRHGLTARELQVLRLVTTGITNQAIGQELHLATKTVDRHVGNILAKLGVSSRTAATAYAYEHGLV